MLKKDIFSSKYLKDADGQPFSNRLKWFSQLDGIRQQKDAK